MEKGTVGKCSTCLENWMVIQLRLRHPSRCQVGKSEMALANSVLDVWLC